MEGEHKSLVCSGGLYICLNENTDNCRKKQGNCWRNGWLEYWIFGPRLTYHASIYPHVHLSISTFILGSVRFYSPSLHLTFFTGSYRFHHAQHPSPVTLQQIKTMKPAVQVVRLSTVARSRFLQVQTYINPRRKSPNEIPAIETFGSAIRFNGWGKVRSYTTVWFGQPGGTI